MNADTRPVQEVRAVTLIRTLACCGKGEPNDPFRLIEEYWTMDGILVARRDGWKADKIHDGTSPYPRQAEGGK